MQTLPPGRENGARPLLARLGAIVCVAMIGSCSTAVEVGTGEPAFTMTKFSPSVLLPGSILVIEGEGFRANEPMKLMFQGEVTRPSGAPGRLDFTLTPKAESGRIITAEITDDLIDKAGGGGEFNGKLALEVTRDGTRHTAAFTVTLEFARELTPKLKGGAASAVYFGDHVKIPGENFLLGGKEGLLELILDGEFKADGGGTVKIDDYAIAARAESRETAIYVHTPELFGLRTGEFVGTLVARNTHQEGKILSSPPLPLELIVLPSSIAGLSVPKASRFEYVRIGGHGFYSSTEDGVLTELRVRGSLVKDAGGTEPINTDLRMRIDSPDEGTWWLAPTLEEGELVGFGAKPGRFTGTIAPVISLGTQELVGQAWQGTFQLLPTKQVVFVKFTPNFTEALRTFGLRNLERAVKDRILEVARRDYAAYNVEFRDTRPTDFEQFTTVEVTGDDPNDVGLFGLDNTEGKDLGNLRLNDYVGGSNAEQIEAGSFAFGGVFVLSFIRISPNVCRVTNDATGVVELKYCKGRSNAPLISERFDEIFAGFAPILGGTEAKIEELTSGPRAAKVAEAVRVFGNISGNTLVHELGHSLGLAQEIGSDEFHNAGDTSRQIMNPGAYRSFEERAELEIDGEPQGPGVWADGDAAYLQEILPRPQE